ncbi:Flp family type IVb pilin [Nocardioides sp. zg-ZUI104]|uniref:Flp family type IVb pilin n=1 Tax=Nocardioides faecalis TaxID=2803858 RepID=UPI001BCBD3B0|nr:Flp family type IVb pilin [Nocardioides faecalis]MBS4752328.1 Flp family type IVb pilin [Nocardioides faecalis]
MVQYLSILLNARFAKMEERGATAVEYGLLVALIAAVIVAAVAVLGKEVLGGFNDVNSELQKP